MSDDRELLERWVAALQLELGLDDVDIAQVLDLARDAAHDILRPAAPLTTFMVGLAAGKAGASAADVAAAVDRARALSASFPT